MKKLVFGLMMLFAFSYTFSQVEGTWKIAYQAGAIGVGPGQGDISWWSNSADDLLLRDCFFDDTYVFGADGSFSNVLGDDTWIEEWQGSNPPSCGTPVAPHDGSAIATWTYDETAGTITLDGTGAYLGIPKAYNGGELADPADAPPSITYIVSELSATSMTIDIAVADPGWWRFILTKETSSGEDATLSDLQVDGETISGFSPGIVNYTYGVPAGTVIIPQITLATPTDPDVTSVDITQATSISGDATVVVTAANGTTTMTYTVSYAIYVSLPVTFDDEYVNYDLADFGGNISEIIVDPTNASNMVAQSIKTSGSQPWAGTTIGGSVGFQEAIPFAPGSTFMNVRVWSPTAGIPIRLKVEDSSDPNHSVETETLTTVASEWETILFDFSNEAPGTEPIHYDYYFNKASIFFNFDTPGTDETYYWDDVQFGPLTSVEERSAQQLTFLQNPVGDILTLNTNKEIESVYVYSISGQYIELKEVSLNTYDLSNLSKGVFTVLAMDKAGNKLIGKVLKQ